jgi:hypothetical protein
VLCGAGRGRTAGATVFALEISGWDDYDVGPAVGDMIAYMASV